MATTSLVSPYVLKYCHNKGSIVTIKFNNKGY